MSFEALKNSPVPHLYNQGYRIVRFRTNKNKEIIIYFAKPENAIEYREDKLIQKLCDERLKEIQSYGKGVKRKIHKYKKKSFCHKLSLIMTKLALCCCFCKLPNQKPKNK